MHPAVYLSMVLVSFVCGWALTRWATAFSFRHNAFEMPGPRKIHQAKIPNLGWIGIFGGWILPLLVFAVLVWVLVFPGRSQNVLLLGMVRKMPVMAGVVLGATLSLSFGWLDDRRKISPAWKVSGQILLASLLYVLGVHITLFASHILSYPFTVLWVVCVMNAFNLLDNLDGACAGVAMIACLIFLAVAACLRQYFIALLLAGFLGALGGFLVFNFPPARIFMGNAGSSLVGYGMSTLTILETFYKKGVPSHLAVIMPVLLLAIPMYDTVSVVLIRLRHGMPIYRGDTNHLAHRLLSRGWSGRRAVLAIYGVTALVGAGSLSLPFIPTPAALLVLAASFGLLLLLAFWELR